jgi:hypothetical protein
MLSASISCYKKSQITKLKLQIAPGSFHLQQKVPFGWSKLSFRVLVVTRIKTGLTRIFLLLLAKISVISKISVPFTANEEGLT